MSATPPDLSSLRISRDDPPAGSTGGRRVLPWLVGAVALVALGVVGWLRIAPRATAVQVAEVTSSGGPAVAGAAGITANGYVVARTKASVSAKIPGRMAYLGVSEGSRVHKGQILARIESADYAAALRAARARVGEIEAQLTQARRDLERARTLREHQVLSQAELENAATRVSTLEAQLGAARAQTALAAANLENTNVRAPFDGTVLRKDAEVGEIVAPSSAGGGLTRTAIVTMADLGTLEVEVDVNEAYIAQVHNGQPARITLDAYPDTTFAGQARQVVPTADRQKATVQVKVSILDRDPRILPEMGAKVEFLRPEGAAAAALPVRVAVPADAVVEGAGGPHVWVIENEKVSARPIQVGLRRGELVDVRSGLSGGERVVLHPPATLKEGARVRAAGS